MQLWRFEALWEMLLLPWRRSAAGVSGRSGAAPRRSSTKPTGGKTTETFCSAVFCLWLSGHGARRAGGDCGGNWGSHEWDQTAALPSPALQKGAKVSLLLFPTPDSY